MARRGFIAALALFYALQASWVLYAGVDALAPVASAVTAARSADASGCCAASCGCPEDVRARKACCCDPKAAQAPAPSPGRFSAVEAARCAGVEAAMAQARTQPVLPTLIALVIVPRLEAAPAVRELRPAPLPEASRLEKVPIL